MKPLILIVRDYDGTGKIETTLISHFKNRILTGWPSKIRCIRQVHRNNPTVWLHVLFVYNPVDLRHTASRLRALGYQVGTAWLYLPPQIDDDIPF